LAPAEKTTRRSFRRRRRRSRRPKKETKQAPSAQDKSTNAKSRGELPEVFIYTYTIYKALD
jgi:hypothetical protein